MFKIFGIIVAFTVISTFAASTKRPNDELVDGILINRAYRNGMLSINMADEEDLVCPTNARGNVCADDCKTLLACSRSSSTPIFARKCSELSSIASYCIPGKFGCSIVGDSNNTQCAVARTSLFTCTNIGYFPDATNCKLYHLCTTEIQETYECPPRYVFDSTNFKCKRRRRIRDCSTVNCRRSANKYVVYPGRSGYYAYCGTNGPIMFQCAYNYEFNPKSVNCEFVCKTEGLYPNNENCQQFYECYRRFGFQYAVRLQTCPITMIFDKTTGRCIIGACPTNSTPTSTELTTQSISSSVEETTLSTGTESTTTTAEPDKNTTSTGSEITTQTSGSDSSTPTTSGTTKVTTITESTTEPDDSTPNTIQTTGPNDSTTTKSDTSTESELSTPTFGPNDSTTTISGTTTLGYEDSTPTTTLSETTKTASDDTTKDDLITTTTISETVTTSGTDESSTTTISESTTVEPESTRTEPEVTNPGTTESTESTTDVITTTTTLQP